MLESFRIISLAGRRNLWLVFFSCLLVGLFEVLSVSFVLPFITFASRPDLLESQSVYPKFAEFFGWKTPQQGIVLLGVVTVFLLAASNGLQILNVYLSQRFAARESTDLSKRLLNVYLSKPYGWFIQRNSGELAGMVLWEVRGYLFSYILQIIHLFGRGLVIVSILGCLVLIDPVTAFFTSLFFCGIYLILYFLVRRPTHVMGQESARVEVVRRRMCHESLAAFKLLKLLHKNDSICNRYGRLNSRLSELTMYQKVLAEVPRHVLEAFAFGLVVAYVSTCIALGIDLSAALPKIALFAVAGYRLLPALQQSLGSAASVRFYAEHKDNLVAALSENVEDAGNCPQAEVVFQELLTLQNVSYRYPETDRWALKDIQVTIKKNTSVAFVGHSGAGKSTLVDVLIGLLQPQSGHVTVDGEVLSADKLTSWQLKVGYVPQDIFLLDASIAENIALGVEPDKIDHDMVQKAAATAGLSEFITTQLPAQYGAIVGERGVRLSGGQRQRIGIARALYRDPEILIFDEATSALDSETEAALTENLKQLSGKKTLVLIAHRIATVRHCDQIFVLHHGVLEGAGDFNQLLETSPVFSTLANYQNLGNQ